MWKLIKRRSKIVIFSPIRMLSLIALIGDVLVHTWNTGFISVVYQDFGHPFYTWLAFITHVMFIVAFITIIISDARFKGDLRWWKKS